MTIYELVQESILRNHLLEPGEAVVVGVSGGADSLCLLDSLTHLGYRVIVAHLDHQLRENSSADHDFVSDIAEKFGAKFFGEKAESVDMAEEGRSIEEAGRIMRYTYFLRIAKENGVRSVAVGHTYDDQVETILMNFLRGTGPDGLRGMLPNQTMMQWNGGVGNEGIRLIRPLLGITKEATLEHCRMVGILPRHDPSNEDQKFLRNRIRHELVPLLKTYNPNISSTIMRFVDIMQKNSELLDDLVNDANDKLETSFQKGRVTFNRSAFLDLHHALQRQFLRMNIRRMAPGFQGLTLEAIERGINFISKSETWKHLDWFLGWEMIRSPNWVSIHRRGQYVLSDRYPILDEAQLALSDFTHEIRLSENWQIAVSSKALTQNLKETIFHNDNESIAYIDKSVIGQGARFRHPRQGDRFQPLGMQGTTKLSDFFINLKVPNPARAKWPLLVKDDQIEWVVGLRIAESARIRDTTRRVVRLDLTHTKD
jgi:tRNA(Ile)-lysidine synthase